MHPVRSLHHQFQLLPLSKRMVAILVAVLVLALAIAGIIMLSLLHRHLVDQIDRQLEGSAGQVVVQLSQSPTPTQTAILPSDYFARLDRADGNSRDFVLDFTVERAGRPDVELTQRDLDQISQYGATRPRTVNSSKPGANWRMISTEYPGLGGIGRGGIATIALPMTSIEETMANTALSFFIVSGVLIVAAWVGGHYLVRRSLRPLSNIEEVAGSIAAGDLSQRIPNAPLSTEVGSLSASLNSMLVQIERSFEANEASEQKMRRFVSDASHELRTPLAAIRGYAELYRMGGVSPETTGDVMKRIEAESTRMGNLVEELLTLARLDERPALDLEPLDLAVLVNQTKSDLHAIDPKRNIRILGTHGQRKPSSLIVLADRDQIIQVFVNLAGNIARYTPTGSPVEIAIGSIPGRAVVEFRDHGPGVPREDRVRVFERFYRTGKSRSRELGGSGLGLSIVHSIVENHGGEVSLWETDPHGLTVRIVIPVDGPTESEPGRAQPSAE